MISHILSSMARKKLPNSFKNLIRIAHFPDAVLLMDIHTQKEFEINDIIFAPKDDSLNIVALELISMFATWLSSCGI